jgi:hypothetical protein
MKNVVRLACLEEEAPTLGLGYWTWRMIERHSKASLSIELNEYENKSHLRAGP